MNDLSNLINETVSDYQKRYGSDPETVVAAPGRVNLIGEHTDYNDGFVFPMAIERYTIIASGSRHEKDSSMRKGMIYSRNMDDEAEVLLEGSIVPDQDVKWYSYIQGTIACCLEKGLDSPPFQAVLHSNVPLGGGLSSSASLEVATATLIETISKKKLDPVEKALLCQKAEHEFAGMPCGIMDQFISAMGEKGKAMLLDCRSRLPKMIPLENPDILIMITNSNVKHQLTGSEYPERRRSCERAAEIMGVSKLRDASPSLLEQYREELQKDDGLLYRRAHHVITENDRTVKMAEDLVREDWDSVGELMFASHQSLQYDFEVSCSEIDILVGIARSLTGSGGVIGSRITGGGFGGCTVSLVHADHFEKVKRCMEEEYYKKTGIQPTIFATRPAQGATVIRS